MISLNSIFKKTNNIIIGALHFPPLPGYDEFPGMEVALKNALADLQAFELGGVDAVIIENNYDLPHVEKVSSEVKGAMLELGKELSRIAKIPLGVSVLWNDYQAALDIAKEIDGKFIRVPVFVDKVKTSYGVIDGNPDEVINYRARINAETISLFTDIHVKHAELLSKSTIEESAKLAVEKGSDALIVTGQWTGEVPDKSQLASVHQAVGDFPILTGSGTDMKNAREIMKYANGSIVSTSMKEGAKRDNEVNIKAWQQRIDKEKVKQVVEVVQFYS